MIAEAALEAGQGPRVSDLWVLIEIKNYKGVELCV